MPEAFYNWLASKIECVDRNKNGGGDGWADQFPGRHSRPYDSDLFDIYYHGEEGEQLISTRARGPVEIVNKRQQERREQLENELYTLQKASRGCFNPNPETSTGAGALICCKRKKESTVLPDDGWVSGNKCTKVILCIVAIIYWLCYKPRKPAGKDEAKQFCHEVSWPRNLDMLKWGVWVDCRNEFFGQFCGAVFVVDTFFQMRLFSCVWECVWERCCCRRSKDTSDDVTEKKKEKEKRECIDHLLCTDVLQDIFVNVSTALTFFTNSFLVPPAIQFAFPGIAQFLRWICTKCGFVNMLDSMISEEGCFDSTPEVVSIDRSGAVAVIISYPEFPDEYEDSEERKGCCERVFEQILQWMWRLVITFATFLAIAKDHSMADMIKLHGYDVPLNTTTTLAVSEASVAQAEFVGTSNPSNGTCSGCDMRVFDATKFISCQPRTYFFDACQATELMFVVALILFAYTMATFLEAGCRCAKFTAQNLNDAAVAAAVLSAFGEGAVQVVFGRFTKMFIWYVKLLNNTGNGARKGQSQAAE